MAFEYTPVEKRFPKPGHFESAARNLVGGAGNVVGLLGEGMGELGLGALDYLNLPKPLDLTFRIPMRTYRDVGAWLSEQAQQLQQPAHLSPQWENKDFLDRVTNWNYWTDPQGATADIFSGFGSSLPFMGVGLGARAVGAVLPTRYLVNKGLFELGKRGMGKSLGKLENTKLGRALLDTADTGLNYAATVAPLDAITNSAEIIKPLKERGFSDSEISRLMLGSAAEELPVDLLENFITGNVILGKGFGLRGKTLKGRLGYGSLNIPFEIGGEYVQEGYQTRATQKYQGLPYTESPFRNFINTGELFRTPEERSAAVSGAIGGLIPAVGGTGIHAAFGGHEDAYERRSKEFVDKYRDTAQKIRTGVAKLRSEEYVKKYQNFADDFRNDAQAIRNYASEVFDGFELSNEELSAIIQDLRNSNKDAPIEEVLFNATAKLLSIVLKVSATLATNLPPVKTIMTRTLPTDKIKFGKQLNTRLKRRNTSTASIFRPNSFTSSGCTRRAKTSIPKTPYTTTILAA